ncbi:hypothetical protein B0T14DRAFT_209835 [Immersiella caudata]|uniref:Uncharacterized protein n=1 Tax=Immersiella caudata TaxID=314043 RepID=A0AA39WQ92_9PEZI|nr:hypothetical protein B0T14DRAFT_209835 [Immersiella caudata]
MCRIIQQLQYCPISTHPPVGVQTTGTSGTTTCHCGISEVEYIDPIRSYIFMMSCPTCIREAQVQIEADVSAEDLALSPVLQAQGWFEMDLDLDPEALALSPVMQAQVLPKVDLDAVGCAQWLGEVEFSQVSDEVLAAQVIAEQVIAEQVEFYGEGGYQTRAGTSEFIPVPQYVEAPAMPAELMDSSEWMNGAEGLNLQMEVQEFGTEMGCEAEYV